MTDLRRQLEWAHGSLWVQSLGAMLAPVDFKLPDGRIVAPLHVAPWADDADAHFLPGILQNLRGEWPCVPFGATRALDLVGEWAGLDPAPTPGEVPHGEGSNRDWTWLDAPDGVVRLGIDYAITSPIRRLERHIRPDPETAAVEITLIVYPRHDCVLPIGLHPVFRLPARMQGLRIETGQNSVVHTFPGMVEPGVSQFAHAVSTRNLNEVPLATGGTVDASLVPLGFPTEELVQISGTGGHVALHYLDEGFVADLIWNPADFPGLVLWYSNGGRAAFPWSGRHFALGVEPVCATFDLGDAISAGPNPLSDAGHSTAHAFKAGEPFQTSYRISVRPEAEG